MRVDVKPFDAVFDGTEINFVPGRSSTLAALQNCKI